MNLSQTIFILLVVNLLVVVSGFATENDNPETFQNKIEGMFSSKLITINTEFTKIKSEDFFFNNFVKTIAIGVTTAINLAGLSIVIIQLVLGGWINPIHSAMTSHSTITIIRVIGLTAQLFLLWLNIYATTKLFSYLKGSDK